MYEDEASGRETMTVEDFVRAVSDSVSGELSGRLDVLDERLDGVSGRVDALAEVAAESVTKDELQAVSASLSDLERATLQAGEIGPVLTEEIGPVIIDLMGALLEAWDGDGDGVSDLAPVVTEIREAVRDVSVSMVHPAMITPFTSYTVLEALLFMLVLFKFVGLWLEILGRGFRWLR